MNTANPYFANQVLTASPERLQLMLLEAVLKAARRADELLVAGSVVAAGVELAQAEAVMADLIGSLRKDLAPALVAQVAAVYGFVLKSLSETHLSDNPQPLHAAIRVLEVETETWRLVCNRTAQTAAPATVNEPADSAPPQAPRAVPLPHVAFDGLPMNAGGFSFEA